MREIKFRAWDKENQKMRTVTSLHTNRGSAHVEFGGSETLMHKENIELMQYTGLKDKNGVEIYEGDVVQVGQTHFTKPAFKAEIHYSVGHARWFVGSEYLAGSSGISPGICEVIGNIHENPELLEGES